MNTYLIADIHGMNDKFQDMLFKIKFSESDRLYIIGDVIDRGPDGVKILQQIMNTKNMYMMPGNHELMMIQSSLLATDEEKKTIPNLKAIRENWIETNGGYPTMKALYDLPDHGESIIKWVSKRFAYTIHRIEVTDGRKFMLCHGWPSYSVAEPARHISDCVWGRPKNQYASPEVDLKGATLVIGHTPVINLVSYQEELDIVKSHCKILHAPNFIDIDCGCGHNQPYTRLACINIDTMEEFYV